MRGDPVTSSAKETADSSLGTARSPNSAQGLPRRVCTTRTQGIFDLPVHMFHHPVALRVVGSGEHVQIEVHTSEVCPVSVMTVAGTPKRATQLRYGICARASMLRRGAASTHLVDLSIAVNRYTCPSEEA
jgi:hypothetical protein